MKYKTNLVCCLCLLLSATTFSQEKKVSILKTVETSRFKKDPTLGGDVFIQASTKEVIGDHSYITFEMEVPRAGNYVLNAWILPSQKPDSSFTIYDVQLNGVDIAAKLQAKTSGWQTLALPGMLRLEAGRNTVSIRTKAPEIPNVEFIRLSTSSRKASISSAKYDDFARQVASGNLQSRNSIQPAAAQYPNTPYASYTGVKGVDLYYTFHVDFFFYEGQEIYLQTSASNNHAHVLEIHDTTFPELYTWHAKSNSQGRAWLRIRTPFTGTYHIRVRSANQGTSGLVDISVNDWVTFENFTVTNMAYFREYRGWEGTYNTFTANSTTNPCLWIEDAFSGNTIASNLDYRGYQYTSDFDWGTEARVKYSSFGAVAVNAQNAYEPIGTCDLYLGCPSSGGYYEWMFENLKEDDEMISAPGNTVYNCISWSGGITDDWEWPFNVGSDYCYSESIAALDSFYCGLRYDGCTQYITEDVTPENAVIDIWAIQMHDITDITHASIRRNSDKNMHGYDWESKLGTGHRIFHPRNSLRGEMYGNIIYSYRLDPMTATNYSLGESIADGKSVMENVVFNNTEKAIIASETDKLTAFEKSSFMQRYDMWKET